MFWLVLYRFAFENGVAFVNVLTHTMLSWSIVAQGLHRTVLVMFGGSLLVGAGGVFLALLGLVALVFAVCLFALKVLLLMVLAVLFVAGPLFIALTPLPTVGDLARGWLLALVGICLIPVGWCIIFATAGAISLDVTNLGGGAHIGSRVVGAFAALATFYIALKWPLMVLGHVRGASAASAYGRAPSSGGGSVVSDGALAAQGSARPRRGSRQPCSPGARASGSPRERSERRAADWLVWRAGRHDRILRVPRRAVRSPSGPPRARPRPTARGGARRAGGGCAARHARRGCATHGEPPASHRPSRGGAQGSSGRGAGHGRRRAAPDATPGRRRRRGASGSGAAARKPSRAGGPPPGPRTGGSSAAAAPRAQRLRWLRAPARRPSSTFDTRGRSGAPRDSRP